MFLNLSQHDLMKVKYWNMYVIYINISMHKWYKWSKCLLLKKWSLPFVWGDCRFPSHLPYRLVLVIGNFSYTFLKGFLSLTQRGAGQLFPSSTFQPQNHLTQHTSWNFPLFFNFAQHISHMWKRSKLPFSNHWTQTKVFFFSFFLQ